MFININPMTNAKALISIAKPVMFIRTIKKPYDIPKATEMMQALRGISRVFFFFLLTEISFGLGWFSVGIVKYKPGYKSHDLL